MYGFNDKENDNEIKGEGGQQDYGMRIYDPRIGRFLSMDPLSAEYPWNSTYAFAENDPINFIDIDGTEKGKVARSVKPKQDLPKELTTIVNIFYGQMSAMASNGQLPPIGGFVERWRFSIGSYTMIPALPAKNGDPIPYFIARKYLPKSDRAPNGEMQYKDEYLVPYTLLGEFRKNNFDYEQRANIADWFQPGGSNMWEAYKSTWNAQNIITGLTLGGVGVLSAASGRGIRVTSPNRNSGVRSFGTSESTTFGGPGAMTKLKYEAVSYHGKIGNSVKNKAPNAGQGALDLSLQVKETSPRRIGIDYTTNEIVVFDRTINNIYHGHVRVWSELTQEMRNVLIKNGMTNNAGKVIGNN